MTEISSTVEVEADPMTAFTVFTDELDQWWGNGPIDAWDSSRAIGRRIEPGVGGRLIEQYADNALELGRVTVWEPGTRVAWQSSVDDVVIDVTFEPIANGTRVRVEGRVPEGGTGSAGLSYVTMTPQWLPRHLARRAAGVVRPELARLNVVVRYAKPVAAAHWLMDAFGLEPTGDVPAEDGEGFNWVEFRVGAGAVMLWPLDGLHDPAAPSTHEPWVYVDDLDAHFARAEARGATIVDPINHHGFRAYTAADPDGRRWTFAQARPTMALRPEPGVRPARRWSEPAAAR